MKRIFSWSMLAMIMVAMLSAGFWGCSSDDDDGSGNGIVGTWTGYEGRYSYAFTFKSDGTGTLVTKYEDKYSGTETNRTSFTYSMSGNNKGIMTAQVYDSYSGKTTEILYFEIEGKIMLIYDEDHELKTSLTKESSGSGSYSNSTVTGTWFGKESGSSWEESLTLTFKSDGTGTWVGSYYDSYSGSSTEKGTFTYEMEGKSKGVIAVKEYSSYSGSYTDYIYFEIEGKTMYLYEDYYGDDLEWTLTKQ